MAIQRYKPTDANTLLNTNGFWRLFKPAVSAALIFLVFGSGLSGETRAEEPSIGGDIRLTETLNQLLGPEAAERYRKIIPAEEEISWEVYLPNNDSTEKPGVFVYVSPLKTGRIDSRWRSVMNQQNLIYISANKSGNKVLTNRRMILAIMAIRALAKHYSFSIERMYVSGFSGGGRVASKLATQYPEIFVGAVYICGVDRWKKDQTPKVDRLIQNRFVFLTGTRDFNRQETSLIHRRYLKSGAEHSKLMVIPGMGHTHPDGPELTEALQFLDGQDQS